MSTAAPKQATYADVLAAPAGVVAELIQGVLHTSPRPASPHAHAASVLGMDLGTPFQRGRGGPGGWWILDEPELHLGENVLVPDVAGWRRERMPTLADVPYFELAPDWVCEVLSRSTEAVDRGDKLPIYAAACVEWLWLVNPRTRTLEVYERQAEKWLLHATHRDDARVHAPPFHAIELSLSDLWLPSQG